MGQTEQGEALHSNASLVRDAAERSTMVLLLHQVQQQQQEVERLSKELQDQRAEVALLRSSLESKETVRRSPQLYLSNPNPPNSFVF